MGVQEEKQKDAEGINYPYAYCGFSMFGPKNRLEKSPIS